MVGGQSAINTCQAVMFANLCVMSIKRRRSLWTRPRSEQKENFVASWQICDLCQALRAKQTPEGERQRGEKQMLLLRWASSLSGVAKNDKEGKKRRTERGEKKKKCVARPQVCSFGSGRA